MEIFFQDGTRYADELAVANAHPLGAKPFGREDYLRKFVKLTEGILFKQEAERFLEVVQRLPHLSGEEIQNLSLSLPDGTLVAGKQGIF